MKISKKIISSIAFFGFGLLSTIASAQVDNSNPNAQSDANVQEIDIFFDNDSLLNDSIREIMKNRIIIFDSIQVDTSLYVKDLLLPEYIYTLPPVYTHYSSLDTVSPLKTMFSDIEALNWLEKESYKIRQAHDFRQNFFIRHPELVIHNLSNLPSPPKQFIAVADPDKAIIVIEEVGQTLNADDHNITAETKEYHWIKSFDGLVQFSQAYNSPNWYQGGNSHLNLLINAVYNVKLNQNYHPNLLFDTTIQYKLAMNSTPDDSLRSYNISEELFQINSKFGLKATKRWYYTFNVVFKTQFLNNYQANTRNMTAAFLSPGELNTSLGMTYNYTNPKKTVDFSLTLAPGSWNLKTCINRKMDVTQFDIKPGRKTVSQFGSSIESTLAWKIAYNITLKSRLFVFTDYSYLQGDLENTLSFSINKYLSTQIYVHLRYDSSTPRDPDTKWHTWQLREILSFGFAYKFATI
ncbi:MAG: DUF3078 domain-containing protein [Muribaculaceae bacterium]|nr:DUF3078 domain-containing protein [Muribaculaceae bacterium]